MRTYWFLMWNYPIVEKYYKCNCKGFDVHLYGDQGGNYVILGARPFGLHLFFLLEAPRPYDRIFPFREIMGERESTITSRR